MGQTVAHGGNTSFCGGGGGDGDGVHSRSIAVGPVAVTTGALVACNRVNGG